VRGTGGRQAEVAGQYRFIPACAGNGQRPASQRSTPAVHPRVCGERLLTPVPPLFASGSSPRVRGTGGAQRRDGAGDRFIPACAGNGAVPSHATPRLPVHPRVCGERAGSPTGSWADNGSSPRVRGTGVRVRPDVDECRFIPACAGNGRSTRAARSGSAVHPRVCGERLFMAAAAAVFAGSSPRVRGTVVAAVPGGRRRRFIPACAGNGGGSVRSRSTRSVHPRVCGERGSSRSSVRSDPGSSPRVRGTGRPIRRRGQLDRFIPACAGNGDRAMPSCSRISVHPRVCGERATTCSSGPRPTGSSPRVRGTAYRRDNCPACRRFIPACAGNGRCAVTFTDSASVHPRVCGERRSRCAADKVNVGSSPRVRGTVVPDPFLFTAHRFIPACAGNGGTGCSIQVRRSVHPRVCGERFSLGLSLLKVFGSSPRVRGTVAHDRRRQGRRRFIPACAGNGTLRVNFMGRTPVHPRVCGEREWRMRGELPASGSSPRVRGTAPAPRCSW